MSRSKSILLQVAFKEAVGATLGTDSSVAETTQEFYNTLLSLHESNGITIEDGGSSGGGQRSFPAREVKALPQEVVQFTAQDGTVWIDWRPAKAAGNAVAKHPDFKTKDNKTSEWLFAQDGSENPVALELAAASDAVAALQAPM